MNLFIKFKENDYIIDFTRLVDYYKTNYFLLSYNTVIPMLFRGPIEKFSVNDTNLYMN